MSNLDAPPNSVGWHILEGYPWWPVYICDATKLRPNLHLLGSGHKGALRKARDFPKDYGLVYFFGTHNFGPVRLKKGLTLRPWDCAEKEKFLKGVPNHLVKKKAQLDELLVAIQEAEDYLSTPEDIRLPPHMVPSDLDPSLEPPPPIERTEYDEDDEDDEDAHEDGEDGHDGDDDADMSGGSDHERRSKKSKDKAKKTKKSSSSSKDKKASSSKSSSSSKDKDKKASKSKKDSKDSKDNKDSKDKKSSKKDKDPSDDSKKRKTLAGSDESASGGVTAAAATKAPPSKVAKKDKTADVKADAKVSKLSSKSKSEKAAAVAGGSVAATGEQLSGEALSAVLEKEIKWILANCQFEEMTTKTVRKLLEKRLQMDLRHHKASIKDGVARVIASMEDGVDAVMAGAGEGEEEGAKSETASAGSAVATTTDADAGAAAAPSSEAPIAPAAVDKATTETPVATEAPATPALMKDETLEMNESPAPTAESSDEPRDGKKEEESDARVVQYLQDAERELGLALNEEPKLVAALHALQKRVPSVDKAVLAKSALLPTLVTLRAHDEKSVSSLVAAIASQWDAADLVPAPKPIREEDILEMKEKLENVETSHDDVLACLNELAKMRLQMSHLKNTGIARVVANLRQHANDKVSIAAINLRKSWIQLTKSTSDNKSDADRVKTLENMNRILEQKDSAEGESSHLAVLEKLQGMTLSTQDIIKSKIGVVVSKLRKSPNEKVAKAATLLRKKWKAEAAA